MIKYKFFLHTDSPQKAQSAVEYMLLLTVVAAIVLLSMKTLFPRVNRSGEVFYNKTTYALLGEGHHCGDGVCTESLQENALSCCVDCGGCSY